MRLDDNKPKVKIKTKGVGGRRSEEEFGISRNSVLANLAFMDKETQRRYRENKMRAEEDASSLEKWAANDFHSGFEVT